MLRPLSDLLTGVGMKRQFILLFVIFIIEFSFSGCSVRDGSQTIEGPPVVPPTLIGPDPGYIPEGGKKTVRLGNKAEVLVTKLGGGLYYEVEAVFSPDSFAMLAGADNPSIIALETDKAIALVSLVGAIRISAAPAIGYFSFLMPYNHKEDLMGSLRRLRFAHRFYFNPAVTDRESLRLAKKFKSFARSAGTENMSGLQRMGAVAFAKQAKKDTGLAIDGSSVRVGITDTGITLAHPTFSGADSKATRITYMKDFTGEGRVYFAPDAVFSLKIQNDLAATLDAEVLGLTAFPALPPANKLEKISGMNIKLSKNLKKALENAGTRARLGFLYEAQFQSNDESADINHNGKINDKIPLILVPGKTAAEHRVYADWSGSGDFSGARPVGDWNATGNTMDVFAERIGFDIHVEKLPVLGGKTTLDVVSASPVGFDPGNHGSHVAGIAAGRKTILNDPENTLARGVAPNAKIMMNRVCSNTAGCSATKAIIDLAMNAGADVINMSLGGLSQFNDGYGVQETVINRLTRMKNVLFIISAGNSGPGKQTVGSPSVARLSLSVGATATQNMIRRQYQRPGPSGTDSDQDFMLYFSSRGPTAAGGFKPNISAPGTELSAIQLNSAPGEKSGLDVYWGTSMAAPAATGAYALLLDAVRKFNKTHPAKKMPADSITLRNVLVESARPFDTTSFDTATGAKTKGRYTWADQGAGMVDLVAAWKKLRALAGAFVPSVITLGGSPVEPDYNLIVPAAKNPNGGAYDGSRSVDKEPVFGTGLYISHLSRATLAQVHVARKLPEHLAASADAAPLVRQLETTREEFVLRTVIHGSDKQWIIPGVLEQLPCKNAPADNLGIIGHGAGIKIKTDGTGTLVPGDASTLNICIDRELAADLPPGEHGALIYAYRTAGGLVSPVASFVVPVYMLVPHKTMEASTGYLIDGVARSFDVIRNSIFVPPGTTMLDITLEVPPVKLTSRGDLAPGEECSGVEMMAYEGGNTQRPGLSKKETRVSNCAADGTPMDPPEGHVLKIRRAPPNAGMYELHVFGQFKYSSSKFKLKIDYITSESSIQKITGGIAALAGSFTWNLKEASMPALPDVKASEFSLSAFSAATGNIIKKGDRAAVAGPQGTARTYPDGAKRVDISTGGSPGNDIDVILFECPEGTTTHEHQSCITSDKSAGASDEELVSFIPKKGKVYFFVAEGFEIKDEGKFTSTETITMPESARGSLFISGASPSFNVTHSFDDAVIKANPLFLSELFTSGRYTLNGSLFIAAADGSRLAAMPVVINGK